MDKFLFWRKWLLSTGYLIAAFGIFMSFFSGSAVFRTFDSSINSTFWQTETVAEEIGNFQKWVYGAWGATVAGWGIFIIFLARHAFQKKERWVWNCIFSGILIWFLIDTGFSAYFRVSINVIFNCVLFALTMTPLAFTRKYFS